MVQYQLKNLKKLSKLLNEARIPHEVINAKSHEKEAMIVAKLVNMELLQ